MVPQRVRGRLWIFQLFTQGMNAVFVTEYARTMRRFPADETGGNEARQI